MGGVGVALPQDSLSVAYNPAGMALLCNRLDIGFNWLYLRSETRGVYSSKHILFPELGVNFVFCRDMSLGVATYLKGIIVSYGRPDPAFGTTPLRFKYHQSFITPYWSWAITDCHSIGIAINIAYGVARIGGLQNLPSAHPTDLTNRGHEESWGVGFSIGWLGHFLDMFSIGLAYESKTWMSHLDKYRGFFPDGGQFDHPSSITCGTAFHFCPEMVFSFDMVYIFWSDVQGFGNHNRGLFGSKGGPGFDWDNQLVLKFGLAYDFWNCLTLRIGYNYGQDPIPSRARFINTLTLATIRHHITTGASFSWQRHEFSIAYIRGLKSHYAARQDQVSLSYGTRF